MVFQKFLKNALYMIQPPKNFQILKLKTFWRQTYKLCEQTLQIK
jgi:hypothetical protein